jgi:hypothetical protein
VQPLSPRQAAKLRKQVQRCKQKEDDAAVLQALGDEPAIRLRLGACAAKAGQKDAALAHYQAALQKAEKDEGEARQAAKARKAIARLQKAEAKAAKKKEKKRRRR